MKRAILKAVVIGLSLLASTTFAQDYPAKPIRIVAPFAPGGAVDILARILAERLGALYGQNIIVDNKPGVSGHLGAQFVAKSPADGYTLMVGTIGIHAAYASYSKLNYKPADELQPVMVIGESPNVVVVPQTPSTRALLIFWQKPVPMLEKSTTHPLARALRCTW
jgi:tripartite-type tricarboxylate transporter receptor subunit TctC